MGVLTSPNDSLQLIYFATWLVYSYISDIPSDPHMAGLARIERFKPADPRVVLKNLHIN